MSLNPKIIDINVDKKYLKKIVAKQGDVKSRYLLFRFFNDYGVINLNNASARIYIDKPDGTQIFNDLVIDKTNNLAELELTTQALALSGILKCELFINEEGATLSNIPFEIEVIKTLKKDSAIESTNEFSALTEALKKIDNIKYWEDKINENSVLLESLDNVIKSKEYIEVNLNQYKDKAGVGTNQEDWTPVFNYVFSEIIKNNCGKIKWNGQLKVRSTIRVPYGVDLEGASLPYSGLVPTADFSGEWIIEDTNIKSHNSYRNIYLAFQHNDSVKGLKVLNPYDYCSIEKIVGDSPNSTFIEIGGSELSQTLRMEDCICYGKSTCNSNLYILNNLQEGYIVNNKSLFTGVGTTNPMYCDGVTNTTFINNSYGFSSAAGLKIVCINYPKRIVGNLIEGNLFENCSGDYAIEIIGHNENRYEGYNNTIRDNCYFGGSDKVHLDYISDCYVIDKAFITKGDNARRITTIQKYAKNSKDVYGNLSIEIDGRKLEINGDVFTDKLNSKQIAIINPNDSNLLSYIKRNLETSIDEGLEFAVDNEVKMKLKGGHIYNWVNGGGVVLWSQDGNGYLITVTNEGTLNTTKL
ncbi:MAG: BppU family phage baseplate upper protein [Clostridium perfringens]|nr:BppU family phage baseplate upper protein [Clostridium perfringens]